MNVVSGWSGSGSCGWWLVTNRKPEVPSVRTAQRSVSRSCCPVGRRFLFGLALGFRQILGVPHVVHDLPVQAVGFPQAPLQGERLVLRVRGTKRAFVFLRQIEIDRHRFG